MSKISPNFFRKEFACKCGCGFDTVDNELLIVAEIIRDRIGPYSPSSACRCWKYHKKIYKKLKKKVTKDSKHLIARAIDVKYKKPSQLYDYLNRIFPNTYGIGLYSWGIHVDTREKKARW